MFVTSHVFHSNPKLNEKNSYLKKYDLNIIKKFALIIIQKLLLNVMLI